MCNDIENNSLVGDYIREEHKGSVEYWKDKVRETIGENTLSQITNGILTAYGDTVDLGVGAADTVLDAVLAFSSCTMGAVYCDTAMNDLKGANQTAYDAMEALSSGKAWDSIVNTFAKAQQGDQKALEEVAGILSSILTPSKIVARNAGKTGGIVNKVDDVVNTSKTLDNNTVNKILAAEKGNRPDPSTYMSKAEIDAHLAKFEDGAVRFASKNKYDQYGSYGQDGGFIMPKTEFERIMFESKGDLRVVEQKLGLDKGYLSSSDTMVVFIDKKDISGLRVPSGNEIGANQYWRPGGYTSGGVAEAVMDFSHKPKGTILDLNKIKEQLQRSSK